MARAVGYSQDEEDFVSSGLLTGFRLSTHPLFRSNDMVVSVRAGFVMPGGINLAFALPTGLHIGIIEDRMCNQCNFLVHQQYS
jgi:hypothetical protein